MREFNDLENAAKKLPAHTKIPVRANQLLRLIKIAKAAKSACDNYGHKISGLRSMMSLSDLLEEPKEKNVPKRK